MAGPVVQGALTPHLALAIPLSPVLLQGLDAPFAFLSVKPAAREHQANRVDAIRDRLLRHNLNIPQAQPLERLDPANARPQLPSLGVMGQDVATVAIVPSIQALDDLGQALA